MPTHKAVSSTSFFRYLPSCFLLSLLGMIQGKRPRDFVDARLSQELQTGGYIDTLYR